MTPENGFGGRLPRRDCLCQLRTIRCSGLGTLDCVVTAKTQYSLANAKNYFSEHLKVGDYYRQGHRMEGRVWTTR
jgi:hypothetical protein